MVVVFYLVAAVVLLAANFFFVLAEFAIVRVRAARVEALAAQGNTSARALQQIQDNFDEYLSVVQVGITGATLGMGFIVDDGLVFALGSLTNLGHTAAGRTMVGIAAFLIATYLTIVLSELVPKALAIRHAEAAALLCAQPLRVLRLLFLPLLPVLSQSARAFLRFLGIDPRLREPPATEEELRIILGESQEGGVIPLRRLLLFENVFDFGQLRARDTMRPRDRVVVLRTDMNQDATVDFIHAHRYSRYPLVRPDSAPGTLPLGVVHAKDLLYQDRKDDDLTRSARPFLTLDADTPLERALAAFQRSRSHLAMVTDSEETWIGILSFEDVIEEIVGQIEDEFEREEPLFLDQIVQPGAVALDVMAPNLGDAIASGVRQMQLRGLPPGITPDRIGRWLRDRERSITSYVGKGMAVPHLRVEGLTAPILGFIRIAPPIPVPGRRDQARLAFVLLTPTGAARVHLRLMARIALMAESEYILDRLAEATTPNAIVEAIGDADRLAT